MSSHAQSRTWSHRPLVRLATWLIYITEETKLMPKYEHYFTVTLPTTFSDLRTLKSAYIVNIYKDKGP